MVEFGLTFFFLTLANGELWMACHGQVDGRTDGQSAQIYTSPPEWGRHNHKNVLQKI